MSRILVEASAAFDQGAGIGRYARNIIDRLVPDMPEHRFAMFHVPVSNTQTSSIWAPPGGSRTVTYPLRRKRFDQLHHRLTLPLPIRLVTGAQDVMYSPDFSGPMLRGTRRIVTFHDVAFLTHPQLITPGMVTYLTRLVEREVDAGSTIVAVSQVTRTRVSQLFGINPEEISVVPNGVDRRFFEAEPPSLDLREELRLPDEYLLMVGTLEPRKNHEAVLRCISRRRESPLPLILVGRRGWGIDHLLPEIDRLHTNGQVVWLEGLDDAHLPAVVAGAKGMVYPSWTEGFGLPALEGLAAGKPVITGDDPVFDEVAGRFAIKVHPDDEDALLDAIRMLEEWSGSDCDDLARRERAAEYSWDHAVQKLTELMRTVTRI